MATDNSTPNPLARRTLNPRLIAFLDQPTAEASDAQICVVFSTDRWNDFGYSILADFGFRMENGSLLWVSGRLALKDVQSLYSLAPQVASSSGGGIAVEDFGYPFASLLSDDKSYSLLRGAVGLHRAVTLLSACNDVALIQRNQGQVPGWPDFFFSSVFTLAMIRSSESFTAYRNGARTLNGERASEDVEVRQPFVVQLKGDGPKHTFNFQFDKKTLRGRIAVLIGKNGAGKTTALAKTGAALVDRESKKAHISGRPDINQVLAFAHSTSLAKFAGRKGGTSALVRAFAMDPPAKRTRRDEPLTRLLHDLARGFDDEGSRLDDFREVMAEELPDLRMCIPVRQGGTLDLPKAGMFKSLDRWLRFGGEQMLLEEAAHLDHTREIAFLDQQQKRRNPSLGQLAFIRFVMTVMANAGRGSVILVDEPENFLHPNLISRFMRVLHRVLNGVKSIAIVATHSPFVVREVQSIQVHVLSTEHSHPVVTHPRLQTLGANVSSISNEVFGDDLPRHLYEEFLSQAEFRNKSFEELLDTYEGEMSIEALMLLRARLEGAT